MIDPMNEVTLPLVSVLTTVYNREAYLAECIESILASTYSNFELIIVDDRSKDNSVRIANDYAARDSRIRVFVNESNLGDYPNRNKAASLAQGKYLKYVDADDYIYPWGLDLLVTMMEQFPEAGWGLCSLDQASDRPFPFVLDPASIYEYNYLGAGLFHKAPLSSIIRRDVFDEAGGFALSRMTGDFEFWHRLGLVYKLLLMPHGIVWSREHDGQEVKSRHEFIGKYEEISVKYLSSPDCPLGAKERKDILRRMKKARVVQFVKALLKLRTKAVKDNWNCLRLYHA
jgi:glycosyltransferase involved in cell wall biosynthesis